MITKEPMIARGPLVDLHRKSGATLETMDGWLIARRYPSEPAPAGNAIVDVSHWTTYEINGRATGDAVRELCGADLPVRGVHTGSGRFVYRLTPTRAIVFGGTLPPGDIVDVTGGWASISLLGPDATAILNKVTAVDLRERTLSAGGCCQGPLFAVNTLFGRFPGRFDLHVCTDSAEFFWEVLLDAGAEFDLRPAGIDVMQAHV